MRSTSTDGLSHTRLFTEHQLDTLCYGEAVWNVSLHLGGAEGLFKDYFFSLEMFNLGLFELQIVCGKAKSKSHMGALLHDQQQAGAAVEAAGLSESLGVGGCQLPGSDSSMSPWDLTTRLGLQPGPIPP